MVTYHHVSEDPRLWLFPQVASTINNSLVFHEFYNPMVIAGIYSSQYIHSLSPRAHLPLTFHPPATGSSATPSQLQLS